MKRLIEKYRKSALGRFMKRNEKYLLIVYFIGGFIFDSLTLTRVDRLYDIAVLCTHMTLLTIIIYLYNIMDDRKFKSKFLEKYKGYFPLAIQFFFGALASAYVIYFSRSVSLSKTASFFVILVALFLANELLRQRISNKYLQFSVYSFISFIFFTFIIPVIVKEMSTKIFLISGLISLLIIIGLILIVYYKSPSTREEVTLPKLLGIILSIYIILNSFYILKLIPPVPLALEHGLVAHKIEMKDNHYYITHEKNESHLFWRDHRKKFIYNPNEKVYVFASVFAPTRLKKSIIHRWKWLNKETEEWEIVQDIGYDITGGRDDGYRGYTYKSNIKEGKWRVDVITEEELVLGVIDFEIIIDSTLQPKKLVEKKF